MQNNLSQKKGRLGENLAAWYYKAHNYQIRKRNYRTRHGELDLVVSKGDTIHFVEVKARSSFRYGQPQDAVRGRKKLCLIYSAKVFLKESATLREQESLVRFQFDIFELDLTAKRYRVVENAFF